MLLRRAVRKVVVSSVFAAGLGAVLWQSPGFGSGVVSALLAAFVVAGPGIAVVVYFAPALAAARLGHPYARVIFALNFLLGWTLVAWVVLGLSALSGKVMHLDKLRSPFQSKRLRSATEDTENLSPVAGDLVGVTPNTRAA